MTEYIYATDGWGRWTGEEIVRCRDCKHVHHHPDWQPDKRFKPKDIWICEAEWCMGLEGDHPLVEPDGFCKWAIRRSE